MLSQGPHAKAISDSVDTDPVLSDDDFQRIANKVRNVTGIILKDHKKIMVQARISRRLRDLKIDQFSDYMNFLESDANDNELTKFCNAITTNLTSFFREPHHFEHLQSELEKLNRASPPRLRIWSAGCSTGEEPHCIALLTNQYARNVPDKKILATDLDTNVLQIARKGVYKADKADSIPSTFSGKTVSADDGTVFSFVEDVQNLITFRRLNILESWPFNGPFDFIFCRNVLIYFNASTKTELIDRFANMLTPNGVLYLGHSETILDDHPLLNSEGRTTYRKLP